VSDHVSANPTRFLIREQYRKRGCFSWSKERFIRLCAKLNETELEVAERVGIPARSILERRYQSGFTNPEGILLSNLEDAIDAMKTGGLR